MFPQTHHVEAVVLLRVVRRPENAVTAPGCGPRSDHAHDDRRSGDRSGVRDPRWHETPVTPAATPCPEATLHRRVQRFSGRTARCSSRAPGARPDRTFLRFVEPARPRARRATVTFAAFRRGVAPRGGGPARGGVSAGRPGAAARRELARVADGRARRPAPARRAGGALREPGRRAGPRHRASGCGRG